MILPVCNQLDPKARTARRGSFAGTRSLAAFTLLEVMIAMGIFFMCMFAILELVSTNLRNARLLQQPPVDVSLVIADLYQTNKLTEGNDNGTFGDLFPGYEWTSQTTEVATNGLFKVEFMVTHRGHQEPNSETHMTVMLWRPESQSKGTTLLPH